MSAGRRLRVATRPLRHGLAYGGLRLVAAALSLLPLDLARLLGGLLGRAVGRVAWRSRRCVSREMARVGVEPRSVGRHFASLGRRAVELALWRRSLRAGLVEVPPESIEALRRAGAGEAGPLVLTAHFGHWELLGAALAAAGVEVHSVAARRRTGPLHRWLDGIRDRAGVRVHPPGGGARSVLERLRGGHPVAVFFDLATRERARNVALLGRPTPFSRTSERLALASGASACLALLVPLPGGRARLVVHPLGPPPFLERAAALLEVHLRARPEEWVWLTERWPDS